MFYLDYPLIDFTSAFYNFTVIMVFLNCCVNPVIYSIKYEQVVRSAVHALYNCVLASTTICLLLPHAVNCGRLCFWRSQSVFFLFVYEIYPEPLNGFAPNSHGRRVWSLVRTSLKVKDKGQGHHGQKRHFSALSAAYVRFMFGKTSLASSFTAMFFINHA